MRRRGFLLGVTALPLARAAEPRVADLFRTLASALSDGDAAAFLRPFDPAMPGFEALRRDIHALVSQAEVLSSVELLAEEGDEARRAVEADWTMQIRERRESGRVTRRRQIVKFALERRGNRWVVTAVKPAAVFAPPSVSSPRGR